jgi:hypothetical protein
MAHLHRWALAFLGSGFGGSSVNAAESAPRQPLACQTESRRSKAELDLRRRGAFWLQGVRPRSGSWLRREVLPPLRQRCYRLCPMRPGHAQDNCRHVESHLPAVGVFPGDWWAIPQHINALVTAERREDSQPTDETTDTDPLMR